MTSEKKNKRIVRIVALVIVAVMLLSVFSGIILVFINERRAKQKQEAITMEEALQRLQADSGEGS